MFIEKFQYNNIFLTRNDHALSLLWNSNLLV